MFDLICGHFKRYYKSRKYVASVSGLDAENGVKLTFYWSANHGERNISVQADTATTDLKRVTEILVTQYPF